MVYIIYMAAGNSRRFGKDKLLYKAGEKKLFEYGLLTVAEIGKTREEVDIIVVTRSDEIKIAAEKIGLRAILSPESKNGASFTIKKALREIKDLKYGDFICFMVADQPFIKSESIVRLIDEAKKTTGIVRLRSKGGPGNPIIFPAELKEELLGLEGDEGGRKILLNHKCTYVDIENETELEDIDTFEDFIKNNGKFNF